MLQHITHPNANTLSLSLSHNQNHTPNKHHLQKGKPRLCHNSQGISMKMNKQLIIVSLIRIQPQWTPYPEAGTHTKYIIRT